MTLFQRLTTNQARQDGILTVRAEAGNLAELTALAEELRMRSNITIESSVHELNDPAPEVIG